MLQWEAVFGKLFGPLIKVCIFLMKILPKLLATNTIRINRLTAAALSADPGLHEKFKVPKLTQGS